MGPGYFVIAILGCADGSVNCTPVMTVPTRYESQAVCDAAAPAALMANSDFDYPSLFAECRPGTARAAETDRKPAASGETRRG